MVHAQLEKDEERVQFFSLPLLQFSYHLTLLPVSHLRQFQAVSFATTKTEIDQREIPESILPRLRTRDLSHSFSNVPGTEELRLIAYATHPNALNLCTDAPKWV